MLKEEIGQWLRKLFYKGATPDKEKELFADGEYIDAHHFRLTSTDGTAGSLTSIGGEEIQWRTPLIYQGIAAGYECIGCCGVSGDEVAFWAHVNGVVDPQNFPPLITINGVVMVRSPLIPYRFDYKLQLGDVSRCVNGLVFPADRKSPALFWDIGAIKEAYANGSLAYLDDFTLDLVSVLPAGPRDWFEHTATVNVGNGLAPGKYIYWPRFLTPGGDRTNPGPPSAPIDIPRVQAPVYTFSGQYPGGQNAGGPSTPDADTPTPYGIELKMLIDNTVGFPVLEIVRQRFNTNQGLNGEGIVEVVARIDITPGQFGLLTFVDPVGANFLDPIAPDQALVENVSFTAPGTVDYFDQRVGYGDIQFNDRAPQITFREVNGAKAVPITNRVFTYYEGGTLQYNDGYADPVNNTYYKTAMHNERQNIGVGVWDGYSGRSYVAEVVENFQYPDRRDKKDGDSLLLSYNRNVPYGTPADPVYAVIASQCQGSDPVAPSFDAIKQGSTGKTNNHFTNVISGPNYNPFRPTSPTDSNFLRYDQKPITKRQVSATQLLDDMGFVFAPEYHALGAAIYGMDNIDAEAPYWEIAEVYCSPEAGRVVAEGMSAYDLTATGRSKSSNSILCFFPDIDSGVVSASIIADVRANPQNYTVKLTPYGGYSETYAYRNTLSGGRFGDLIAGEVFVDNIFPSPPGTIGLTEGMAVFGTGIAPGTVIAEVFGATQLVLSQPATGNGTVALSFGTAALGLDTITYGMMQYEPGTGQPGGVNVGDTAGTQGFQPGASAPLSPTNYIGPAAWREEAPLPGDPFLNPTPTDSSSPGYSVFMDPNNTEQGAVLLGIDSVEFVEEGRGTNLRIRTLDRMYRLAGNEAGDYFDDSRSFHEGLYVVQIIRDGAVVPEQNIQDYRTTATRVVRDRCIALGRAPGIVYDIDLFHARVEDCVPYPGSGLLKYVWVSQQGQPDKRFICFTNAALDFAAAIAAFTAGLSWTDPDGNEVWGAYTYEFDIASSPRIIHKLRFGNYGSAPAEDSRISVRYDSRSPIQVFGFGGTIAPWIFAPYDRYFNGEDNDNNTALTNAAPMPYSGGVLASNYVLPRDGNTGGAASVEFTSYAKASSTRQWAVMGYLNTRTPGMLNLSKGDPEQFPFPQTHYIIRPSQLGGTTGALNGFNDLYDIDYPLELQNNYGLGGFHFAHTYNLDYAKQVPITGKGYPRNGELPQTDGCNYYIVSLQKQPGSTDTPGYQTFISDNLFPISEENGRIRLMRALDQGGYQQLYGWTDRGVHRIPYNKNILVGADGNTVATQGISQFWPREEQWIVRGSKGMPDDMWRMAARANAPVGGADIDTMLWVDRVSAYQLIGGQVVDIARGKYLSRIQQLLATTPGDQRKGFNSLYNPKNNEWWWSIVNVDADGNDVRETFVFSSQGREWVGTNGFVYDQFLAMDTKLIGFRTLRANFIDIGGSYLGPSDEEVDIEKWAETVFIPFPFMQSEAIKWRIGPDKPYEMRVYDRAGTLMLTANEALQEAFEPGTGQYWALNIDSWEQLMNNVDASYDPLRSQPPQSTGYFIRWYFRGQQQQRITFAMLQSRQIP